MIDDLIKRSDAIKIINWWLELNFLPQVGEGILHGIPAADRPQGEWIEENGCVICSECRWNALRTMTGCFMDRHLDYNKSNFCPHCGARMKGASNGEDIQSTDE